MLASQLLAYLRKIQQPWVLRIHHLQKSVYMLWRFTSVKISERIEVSGLKMFQ